MKSTAKFTCLRCGDCCRNLVRQTKEGVHSGLALFPDETWLFPSNIIFPYRGLGENPEEGDFKVVMFQLEKKVCPCLEMGMKEARCKIYEERPLVCRCYPFQPIHVQDDQVFSATDLKCPSIQRLRREGRLTNIEDPAAEIACLELWRRISPVAKQKWVFDLKSKKWRISPISRL